MQNKQENKQQNARRRAHSATYILRRTVRLVDLDISRARTLRLELGLLAHGHDEREAVRARALRVEGREFSAAQMEAFWRDVERERARWDWEDRLLLFMGRDGNCGLGR